MSLSLRAGDTVTYTVWIKIGQFYALTGSIELYDPQTGTTEQFPLDGTISGLDRLNEWLAFSKTYSVTTTGTKTVGMVLTPVPGFAAPASDALTYIDGGQAVVNATSASLLDGSGGATAWLKGVTYLQQNSTAPVTYEATLLDLSRLDSGTWPYDALALGGSVNVADLDLNLTATLRAVQIDRDHLNPLSSRVTLSTRPTTLTDLLVTE